MNIPKKATMVTKPNVSEVRKERQINDFAFGKAGNNAIDIMIAGGLFKGAGWNETIDAVYKELQQRIYKADERNKEEMKKNE